MFNFQKYTRFCPCFEVSLYYFFTIDCSQTSIKTAYGPITINSMKLYVNSEGYSCSVITFSVFHKLFGQYTFIQNITCGWKFQKWSSYKHLSEHFMGHTEHRSFNDSLLVFPPVFSRIGSFSALTAFDITVSLLA
jgi:hypothetical protein